MYITLFCRDDPQCYVSMRWCLQFLRERLICVDSLNYNDRVSVRHLWQIFLVINELLSETTLFAMIIRMIWFNGDLVKRPPKLLYSPRLRSSISVPHTAYVYLKDCNISMLPVWPMQTDTSGVHRWWLYNSLSRLLLVWHEPITLAVPIPLALLLSVAIKLKLIEFELNFLYSE